MKRYLLLLLAVVISLTALTSCSSVMNGLSDVLGEIPGLDLGGIGLPEQPSDTETPEDTQGNNTPSYTYTAFTPAERTLFETYVGLVIPFAPNNEYYVEGYDEATDYESGLHFYTFDNTKADFDAYRATFTDYTLTDSREDDYGNMWYTYVQGDVVAEIGYHYYKGHHRIDVYVYSETLSADPDQGGDGEQGGNDGDNEQGGDVGGDTDFLYTAFTAEERELFMTYIGLVIPFVPNDEYYIEGYYDLEDYENGLNFYTLGNTEADFEAYLAMFTGYTLVDSYKDTYGDTWYTYTKGDVVVDLAYYYYENEYWIDVFVYSETLSADPDQGGDGEQGGDVGGDTDSLYTAFTAEERELFMTYIGLVIPFVPNDEYYIEGYYDLEDYENGLNFYTLGNTEADFEAYLAMFTDYTLVDSYEDTYGDTWYTYTKGDVVVDLAYYYYENEYWIDVFVYSETLSADPDQGGDGEQGGDVGGDTDSLYIAFTAEERELFMTYIGLVIPFVPNDEYYVEGYYDLEDYENGINFYTLGNTEADFEAYLAMFAGYTLEKTYQDDYGDTWYIYTKGDVVVDLAYYYYQNEYWIDVFVYSETLSADPDQGGDGEQGGNDGEGDGWFDSDIELMPNDGKGLPTDADGVYDVDFTDAEYVQDATDLEEFKGGSPSTDRPAVLVIPVDFSDRTAASLGYSLDKLHAAFLGAAGTTDSFSVHEYYSISSYGALDLDITVLDFWFRPANASTYYAEMSMDYYGYDVLIGDQVIMHEALSYLADIMDLSQFDSDGNGYIDSVVLIQTLEIAEDDFHWAFRYWNIYTNGNDQLYQYDGVSANDYMWASYQFMHKTENIKGKVSYTDTNATNTSTYIHEMGHILGADDYYDTAYVEHPMDGHDIMDQLFGDHNAFTKFHYGWLTTSRLVVTDSSVTLALEAFDKSGDTILLATDWDDALGAYQEYFIIVYYRNVGLNGGEGGYFGRDGIIVYHVNATLCYKDNMYDIYNNNTSPTSGYGSENNLIEFVLSPVDTYTYIVGDSLGEVITDDGDILGYTFTVDVIDGEWATLTFTKVA